MLCVTCDPIRLFITTGASIRVDIHERSFQASVTYAVKPEQWIGWVSSAYWMISLYSV